MNYYSQALLPAWIGSRVNRTLFNVLSIVGGSLLLAALAQVSIHLPFTLVPITGQTLGVSLLALCWGARRAAGSFGLYLFEGAIGLPVFALGKAGLIFGPTSGYLAGMFLATLAVGHLADRGLASSVRRAFLCCLAGSALVFSCGLLGLSFFIPKSSLLEMGLLPFLPGDLIKSSIAATLAGTLSKRFRGNS